MVLRHDLELYLYVSFVAKEIIPGDPYISFC